MFSRLLIAAGLLMLASMAFAQETRPQPADRLADLRKRFPDADTDKDGVLTIKEARTYREQVLNKRKPDKATRRTARIAPTHADVKYGSHQRNVFDLWLPKKPDTEPLALFVYFHGGGFVGGDKSGFDPRPYLDEGMAVASGNYRFVDGRQTLSPAPLVDAARVIQFLRHRATDWNLDKERIAISGNSAGAVISLWIGYHDDLANPSSDDPISRQSTRVKCIAPLNGPTNLDPQWITANMGGPKHIHGSFPKMFGASVADSTTPEIRKRILETSPYHHASKDDPPTLLIYGGKTTKMPLPESVSTGVLIHHAYFGEFMRTRLDELGVPNKFLPGTDPRKNNSEVVVSWLKKHL